MHNDRVRPCENRKCNQHPRRRQMTQAMTVATIVVYATPAMIPRGRPASIGGGCSPLGGQLVAGRPGAVHLWTKLVRIMVIMPFRAQPEAGRHRSIEIKNGHRSIHVFHRDHRIRLIKTHVSIRLAPQFPTQVCLNHSLLEPAPYN
jgi:hypothetical protein